MTRDEARSVCVAAGMTAQHQEIMVPLLSEEPRPTLPALARRLGLTVFSVQKSASRGWIALGRYREAQAASRDAEPPDESPDEMTPEEETGEREHAQRLLDAIRGSAPSNPRTLHPLEGDRDTVQARLMTVDLAVQAVRRHNRQRRDEEREREFRAKS